MTRVESDELLARIAALTQRVILLETEVSVLTVAAGQLAIDMRRLAPREQRKGVKDHEAQDARGTGRGRAAGRGRQSGRDGGSV